jgi:hypothetical protein
MIKFEVDKLTVDIVSLKSCTTALNGSIRVIDEEMTKINGKEIYKKINVPMAIIRAFQVRHKTSNYLKPVITAVVSYNGHPVALERHPLGTLGTQFYEGLDGEREWTPDSLNNIMRFIEPLCMNSDDWYFDGKYIYHYPHKIEDCVKGGEYLTKNGMFRAVEVSAIQLSNLDDRTKLEPAERTCLAFVSSTGQFAITPPIWKNLSGVGSSALGRSEAEDAELKYQFDAVDEHLAVNLAFALKAGKQIGELFGHEEIDPLKLPDLMIELQTVNLPSIAKSVKQTYDIGMKFSHAMAWLIGMSNRIDTLDSYMVIRSLLKYLTTKGIFRKNMFNTKAVFRIGHDLESIPHMSTEDALESASNLSVDELINQIRTKAVTRRNNSQETIVGGLYGAN